MGCGLRVGRAWKDKSESEGEGEEGLGSIGKGRSVLLAAGDQACSTHESTEMDGPPGPTSALPQRRQCTLLSASISIYDARADLISLD